MANFIIAIDPDTDRRQRFAESVTPLLPPIAGLSLNSLNIGDFFAGWACAKQAPVTWVREKTCAAVEWGEPLTDEAGGVDVTELMRLWSDPARRAGAFFNGFYSAAVFSLDTGLAVGADLLGIYPVYYWAQGDVVLVGSSPELFRQHPSFKMQLNPRGVASILLTMHIVGGETLLKGVRRLAAGHMLVWRHGQPVREEKQYQIRVSTDRYDLPFSSHVEALDEAISGAIGRSMKDQQRCCLLLSGGLDSRMLAGYLKERDIDVSALTMGIETDTELRLARDVARKLGFRHSGVEVDYARYAECSERQAAWEHVSSGFNDILNWGVGPTLDGNDSRVVMGHAFDAAVGTRSINWAYSPSLRTVSFDTLFAYTNRWGLSPAVLARLLRRDMFDDGVVESLIETLRETYRSYSVSESQRVWCFNLYHRQRFHVGSSAWAFSFGAWPAMPVLDRKLLECAASIPAASIAERRAQTELLCKRFPHLAAMPLDRNNNDTRPLQPRIRYQVAQSLLKRVRPLGKLLGLAGNGQTERRFYYRVYDIDNPGWRTVRRQAEPNRRKLYELFNKDSLDEVLPGPDSRVEMTDRIVDASGLKALLGLMTWSKEHL
jgi:asparagine synthase (glutamine-hydrolysing)